MLFIEEYAKNVLYLKDIVFRVHQFPSTFYYQAVACGFIAVILSESAYMTDGILKTAKTEQDYLPTVLYNCIIQIQN